VAGHPHELAFVHDPETTKERALLLQRQLAYRCIIGRKVGIFG